MPAALQEAKADRLLAFRVKELEAQIARTQNSLICAFNQLLDLKDLHTGFHSTRLAEWGMRVAGDVNVGERYLHDVEVAALLHDIGKIGVPDEVLNAARPLSEAEWALMKKHSEYGWAIVRLVPGFERASLHVLHHHERYDGAGYPAGLKGEEIPLGARIIAVIDAFDAMTSSRPYRPGLPFDEAIRRLLEARGTQFDAQVVDCFVKRADDDRTAVLAAGGVEIPPSGV